MSCEIVGVIEMDSQVVGYDARLVVGGIHYIVKAINAVGRDKWDLLNRGRAPKDQDTSPLFPFNDTDHPENLCPQLFGTPQDQLKKFLLPEDPLLNTFSAKS